MISKCSRKFARNNLFVMIQFSKFCLISFWISIRFSYNRKNKFGLNKIIYTFDLLHKNNQISSNKFKDFYSIAHFSYISAICNYFKWFFVCLLLSFLLYYCIYIQVYTFCTTLIAYSSNQCIICIFIVKIFSRKFITIPVTIIVLVLKLFMDYAIHWNI